MITIILYIFISFKLLEEVDFLSVVNIQNLTFCYDNSFNGVFKNLSFAIDSNWKLGFIGRNGCDKTTFLNLLMNNFNITGTITSNVLFDYFPFQIENKSKISLDIVKEICPDYEY